MYSKYGFDLGLSMLLCLLIINRFCDYFFFLIEHNNVIMHNIQTLSCFRILYEIPFVEHFLINACDFSSCVYVVQCIWQGLSWKIDSGWVDDMWLCLFTLLSSPVATSHDQKNDIMDKSGINELSPKGTVWLSSDKWREIRKPPAAS